MGIRGELFSTRVSTEGRTYFFNVKENRMGDVFLTIVESKPTEGENFDRRSIVIFRDDVKDFLKAFQGALSFMENPKGRDQGPAGAAASLRFDMPETAGGSPESGRRSRAPAGFAGSGGPQKPGGAPEKRLRVVVRKKGPGKAGGGSEGAPQT